MNQDELKAMLARILENLEKRKRQTEKLIAAVKSFEGTLEGMPPALLQALFHEVGPDEDENEGTHFERIELMFQQNGNILCSIAQIVAATGISRSSVSAVLYRTHSNEFECQDKPGEARTKLWRLANYSPPAIEDHEAYEEEMEDAIPIPKPPATTKPMSRPPPRPPAPPQRPATKPGGPHTKPLTPLLQKLLSDQKIISDKARAKPTEKPPEEGDNVPS